MDDKTKKNKVRKSFDTISKEMARLIVNDKKDQLISEIEKDVIEVEKNKRKKEKNLRQIINKNNENLENLNNTNNDKNESNSLLNSRNDLKTFKSNDIREVNSFNEPKNDKTNKGNNNFLNNSKQENIKKEDIEVTISPFFDKNSEENNEINYYNVRNYIDSKKKEKKNIYINNKTTKIRKLNTIGTKNKKENFNNSKKNKNNQINKGKKEFSFIFEDKQKSDSDDWGDFINNLSFDNNKNLSIEDSSENKKKNKSSSRVFNSKELKIEDNNPIINDNFTLDYFQNIKSKKISFLEKQLNRKRLTEIKINRKRERIKFLESKNNYYSPKIDKNSMEIIRNKGNYVPLFQRAIDIQNEKKTKMLIYKKMKSKSFSQNKFKKMTKNQINDFFKAQMDWKKNIEKENDILKLKLKEKEKEQVKNLKINFPKLKKNILNISKINDIKNSFNLYDNSICKTHTYKKYLKEINKTNPGVRLYKDYEKKQRNLNILKKKLAPCFTPMINKSPLHFYSFRNNKIFRKDNISKLNENSKQTLIYEYDSSFNHNQQKSRNPKLRKSKNSCSSNNYININLKSTEIDSRNSKSRPTIELFNTKLEKINEYKDKDEENSDSDYTTNKSLNKNSSYRIKSSENINKKTDSKINFEETYNKENSKISNNNADTDRNKNKLKDSTKEDTKNNFEIKDTKRNNDSVNINQEMKLEENKSEVKKIKNSNKNIVRINDIKQELKDINNIGEKRTPTMGKDNPININLDIQKKNTEIKFGNNNNIKNNKIMNPFKKFFSKEKAQKKSVINFGKPSKNFDIYQNSDEFYLTNKNDEISKNQFENTFKNQYDSISTNNNIFNFDQKESNYLNDDFFSDNVSSKKSNKDEIIIQNSSYKLDNTSLDLKKSKIETKKNKTDKEIIKQYKFNESDESDSSSNEEIEENENMEEKSSTIEENKTFSWIKQLNEISRNENIKSDRDKKKAGGSTTRTQTNRGGNNININNDDKFFKNENSDENKLYMLNLRSSSSTGNLNPYTVVTKNDIFYKFFLKQSKKKKYNN